MRLREYCSGLLAGCLMLATGVVAADIETGLLWKIESAQGEAGYLFGTMHSDDARVTDFPPPLIQGLLSSQVLLMETLPPPDGSVFFSKQGTLADLLPPQELEQALQQAEARGMLNSMAIRMKPWLLALVLATPKGPSPFSQDMQLYALAEQRGLEVAALETADEHFTSLDALSAEDQGALLRAVVAQPEDKKEQAYEELLKVYLSGDSARILETDEKLSSRDLPPGLWEKMRAILIDRRNAQMAARIIERIGRGKLFVAVGAAHLPGEQGIVRRLRAAGYRVTPLR